MRKNHGFILVYTVLILSIILITGGIFVNTVLKEISLSRDEAESLKAFYAADTGIECVRYLKSKYDAFDTKVPETEYSCGIGNTFNAGGDPPTADCDATTTQFTIDGFTNGACAVVTVTITPRPTPAGTVCRYDVVSDGRNSCGATGKKLVERTRWESM